jgi:hypothetical protein
VDWHGLLWKKTGMTEKFNEGVSGTGTARDRKQNALEGRARSILNFHFQFFLETEDYPLLRGGT